MSDLELLLENLDLPKGVHASVLTGTDARDNSHVECLLVWSDRPYRDCPQCTQPLQQDLSGACPAILNGGAAGGPEVQHLSQEHACGHWLTVYTDVVRGTGNEGEITEADVLASAQDVAEELREHKQRRHAAAMERLRKDLTNALERLRGPLNSGETEEARRESVTTGSELYPGVFRNEIGQWVSWDYDPNNFGETLEVIAEDEIKETGR